MLFRSLGGPVHSPESGGNTSFTLTFHFYGAAGKSEAQEAARMGFQEFKKLYRQLQEEERRKSFQRA